VLSEDPLGLLPPRPAPAARAGPAGRAGTPGRLRL